MKTMLVRHVMSNTLGLQELAIYCIVLKGVYLGHLNYTYVHCFVATSIEKVGFFKGKE